MPDRHRRYHTCTQLLGRESVTQFANRSQVFLLQFPYALIWSYAELCSSNRHGPVSDSQANAGVLTRTLAFPAEPLAPHRKRAYTSGLAYTESGIMANARLD
jgi:hypothetical protein